MTPDRAVPGVCGAILAGGRSSRFGRNKALVEMAGRPLIEHVARTLARVFARCLLVTNTPEEYRFLNLETVGDIFPDAGPLAGIHAALKGASEERVFIAACDMPFLDPDLIRFLCHLSLESGSRAVVPLSARGPEPLCAVYHRDALEPFAQRLEDNRGSVTAALERIEVRWVTEEEMLTKVEELDSFVNLNTPEDMARVQARRGA